jgi:SAM-dependent methyltransferase
MMASVLPPEFKTTVDHYYDQIPGYFDFEHVYRDAVEWLPNGGTFVEVGCWQGQSLAFFLTEAWNSGKRFKVFGCDHFRGSVGDGPLIQEASLKSIVAHCAHNLRRAVHPFALVHAESKIGATFFQDTSIDYCFIDAGHMYDEVKADIAAWLPKMKPGGIMAGHDFNQVPVENAVREAFPDKTVEDLRRFSVEYPNGFKWGTCWRVQL